MAVWESESLLVPLSVPLLTPLSVLVLHDRSVCAVCHYKTPWEVVIGPFSQFGSLEKEE